MKIGFLFLSGALLIISCNSSTNSTIAVPPAPPSAETASQFVKGKTYETEKVAILSPFKTDAEAPYEWANDMKDTTKFFRDYLAERMSFRLQFINDTSVVLQEDETTIAGTYRFDSNTNDEEKEGVKLRISYEDSSMNFPGATEPMIMTYTYFVAGVNEKSLMLETPRSFNNRKVAVLMESR